MHWPTLYIIFLFSFIEYLNIEKFCLIAAFNSEISGIFEASSGFKASLEIP
jgi:hypothetical protein